MATFRSAIQNGREPFNALKFSNVSSCIRRNLLLEIPFKEWPLVEDRTLAYELLKKNWSVAYAAKSLVFHSHYPNFREFRTIGRWATRGRYAMATLCARELPDLCAPPTLPSKLIAWLKIPAVILWAVFKILLVIFKPRELQRARAISFCSATIGTTVGKYDAIKSMRQDDYAQLLKIGDPTPLLNEAKPIVS